jgi:hypothetical protein
MITNKNYAVKYVSLLVAVLLFSTGFGLVGHVVGLEKIHSILASVGIFCFLSSFLIVYIVDEYFY